MGNQPPPKNYNPKLEKQKLEILCLKVKGHLEIQRDRRMGQANQKEQQLIKMINGANRSMEEERHKASSIVSDICYIDSCNLIIRYCDILKDRSLLICESMGKQDGIKELMPYIESIVYSSQHLNLNAMQEFSQTMVNFFGKQPNTFCVDDSKVDATLKLNLNCVMPSDKQINDYFQKLSEKTGIHASKMNEVGHQINGSNDQPQIAFVPNIQQAPFNQPGFGYPGGGFGQPGYGMPNNININVRVQDQNSSPFNYPQQNQFQQPPQNQHQQPPQNQYQQPPQNQCQQPPQNQFQQAPGSNLNQAPQNFQNTGYPQMNQNAGQQPPQNFNFPQIQVPVFNFSPQNPPQQGNQMPYNPPSGNTTGNTNGAEDSNALEARLKKLRDGL